MLLQQQQHNTYTGISEDRVTVMKHAFLFEEDICTASAQAHTRLTSVGHVTVRTLITAGMPD